MSVEYFDIDLFQDYLQDVCEKNKLVAHLKTLPGQPRPQHSFARFESDEQVSLITNTGGQNIVVVADVFGQRTGDPDDGRIRYTVQLRFAAKKAAGTGDETDAVNTAVRNCRMKCRA